MSQTKSGYMGFLTDVRKTSVTIIHTKTPLVTTRAAIDVSVIDLEQ